MRYWVAGLSLLFPLHAAADEFPRAPVLIEEGVVSSEVYRYPGIRVVGRRVACVKCRGSGLPWGGLRPVRRAQLPWGGLPDYCPPTVSRSVVVVTKG